MLIYSYLKLKKIKLSVNKYQNIVSLRDLLCGLLPTRRVKLSLSIYLESNSIRIHVTLKYPLDACYGMDSKVETTTVTKALIKLIFRLNLSIKAAEHLA